MNNFTDPDTGVTYDASGDPVRKELSFSDPDTGTQYDENGDPVIDTNVSDYFKAPIAGALKATGYGIRGVGQFTHDLGNKLRQGVNSTLGTSFEPDEDMLRGVGDYVTQKGSAIDESMSPGAKEALRGFIPTGNILTGEDIGFGDNVTPQGVGLRVLDTLGQIAPVAATALLTRGGSLKAQLAKSAGVASAMGGGAASAEEGDRIRRFANNPAALSNIPVYQEMVARGVDHLTALEDTAKIAESGAFWHTAPVSAVTGLIVGGTLSHAGQKVLSKMVGEGTLARILGGVAIDSPLEGVQEVSELAAQHYGAGSATGEARDIGEGSFGDFVLGAAGGAGPAILGGAMPLRKVAPKPAAPPPLLLVQPNADGSIDLVSSPTQETQPQAPPAPVQTGGLRGYAPPVEEAPLGDPFAGDERLTPSMQAALQPEPLEESADFRDEPEQDWPVDQESLPSFFKDQSGPEVPDQPVSDEELDGMLQDPTMLPGILRDQAGFDGPLDPQQAAISPESPQYDAPLATNEAVSPVFPPSPPLVQPIAETVTGDVKSGMLAKFAAKTRDRDAYIRYSKMPFPKSEHAARAQEVEDAWNAKTQPTGDLSNERPTEIGNGPATSIAPSEGGQAATLPDQAVDESGVATHAMPDGTVMPGAAMPDKHSTIIAKAVQKSANRPALMKDLGLKLGKTKLAERAAEIDSAWQASGKDAGSEVSPTEQSLESVSLLRQYDNRWQYKFSINDKSWKTANSKADAVERATKAYGDAKPEERTTREQRDAAADDAEYKRTHQLYGRYSVPELERKYEKMGDDIASLQKSGRREFSGNGYRRTSPAVSAEGARNVGEEKMKLRRYIEGRKNEEIKLGENIPPNSPSAGIATKKRSGQPRKGPSKVIRPEIDDLLAAIAKDGGLSKEDAKQQGIDPASFNMRGHGISRVFTKNGKSFDAMSETLDELGYPVRGLYGRYDPNALLDQLGIALAGNKVMPSRGHEAQMRAKDAARQDDYEQQAAINDDLDSAASISDSEPNNEDAVTEAVIRARRYFTESELKAILVPVADKSGGSNAEFNAAAIAAIDSAITAKDNATNRSSTQVGETGATANQGTDGQVDAFGKNATAQAIHDRELAKQKKQRNSPDVLAGDGELFAGPRPVQADVEDAPEVTNEIPEMRSLADTNDETSRADSAPPTESSSVPAANVRPSKPASEMTAAELLRAAADKMDAKDAAPEPVKEATQASDVPQVKGTEFLTQHDALIERARDGTATAEEMIAKAKGLPLFAKKAGSASGLSYDAVNTIVARMSKSLGGDIKTTVHASEDTLPVAVKQQAEKEGAAGEIRAVFHDNAVHVVSSNGFKSAAEVEEVMLHEIAGHRGIRNLFAGDYRRALNSLYMKIGGESGVNELAEKAGIDLSSYLATSKRLTAAGKMTSEQKAAYLADELLAHLQGTKAYEGIPERIARAVREFVGAVREMLRKHGFAELSKIGDTDMAHLLKRMHAAALDGGKGGGTMFSLKAGDQTNTEAFKKWFSDSKVTDENNKPLAVYHGTDADFNIFDKTKAGNGPSKFGFWMAEKPDIAEMFGSKLMRVYVSIKNPYKISSSKWDSIRSKHAKDGAWFANWRNELLAKGYDGLLVKGESFTTSRGLKLDDPSVMAAFESTQIKSATDNSGTFDASNPDIRFARKSTGKPALPTETYRQKQQRIWQDNFNRFKQAQELTEKTLGKALEDRANVYESANAMNGKISTQIEDFREQFGKPLIDRTAKAGFSMQQVAEFLEAQHTEEANAQIQKLHNDPTELAFGVTDKEAEAELAKFKAMPNFKAFEKIAEEWRSISDDTLDMMVAAGIATPEQKAAYNGAYKHYVPVRGDEEAGAQTRVGGQRIKGKQKRRLGHGARDEMVIENILKARENAIKTVERNNVRIVMANFLAEANDPSIGTIGKPVKRKVLTNEKSYEVTYKGATVAIFQKEQAAKDYVNNGLKRGARLVADFNITTKSDSLVSLMALPTLAENEVNVYINGYEVRLQLNDEPLARAATGLGTEQLGAMLSAARNFNTFLSKAYTGWNPEFAFVNPIRDFTAGLVNLTGDYGLKMTAKIVKNYGRAVRELIKGRKNPALSADLARYRKAGGSTGAAYLSDLDRIGEDTQAAYHEAIGARQTYAKVYEQAIADGKSATTANALALAKSSIAGAHHVPVLGHFLKLMTSINSVTENALRLATFTTLVENGYSDQKAAVAAKDSTVNFNRKGEITNQMGALYLFFNPNVQGTARTMRALFKSKNKGQAQALVGMMALTAYTLAELARGGDDDEEQKWKAIGNSVKNRNMIVKFGDTMITMPIPYGYGYFFSIGNAFSDMTHGGSASKVGLNLAASLMDNFSPVGTPIDDSGKFIPFQLLPTIPQMALSPSVNQGAFGQPIMPKQYNESKPDSQTMWRGTKGTTYDAVSSALNDLTGGDKYRAGGIDVSPETLKFWTSSLTGGAGRFFADALSLPIVIGQGVTPDVREVPIFRKFVREQSVADFRREYWDRANEAKTAAEEFRSAVRAGDAPAAREMLAENRSLIALAKYAEAYSKAAKAKRDAVDAIRTNDKLSLAQKREQMKLIEAKEEAVYRKFLSTFEAKK